MTEIPATTIQAAAPLTGLVEDYLKASYKLEAVLGTGPTNEIAHRPCVAPASVTGMVRRLASHGSLEYQRYRGVRLTRRECFES